MSYTEYAVRTRFSIPLNSPLRENVGHQGCVRGRSFSICYLFSSEGFSWRSFSQALRSDFSQPLVHSRFQGQYSPHRQPLSPSRSLPMPHSSVNLFQLKNGLMVLQSILSVMTVSLRRDGIESILNLLGDPTSVSDFFLVLARVEHLLITIFDLGFSSLMRWVAPSDWKPDHRDCPLQLLLATDRLSQSASRQEPVQVQAKQMGDEGFIGEFNYIVRIIKRKPHSHSKKSRRSPFCGAKASIEGHLVGASSIYRYFPSNLNVQDFQVMMNVIISTQKSIVQL